MLPGVCGCAGLMGAANLVQFSDQTVEGAGLAGYRLNADGFAYERLSAGGGYTNLLEAWIVPQTGMSGYESRATLNSGALSTGTTGSWQSLSLSQSWASTTTANLTIEIRDATTLAVLDSAVIFLNS